MHCIAILGYGVVGSGTAELAFKNRNKIEEYLGCGLAVKYILNRSPRPGSPYFETQVDSIDTITSDPAVTLVVEAMGGVEPAYTYVAACLRAGKHVVTSNKELVAEKGAELLAIAKQHNVAFLFEASVAGGIPVLHPLTHCLAANNILEVYGILNGTSNFVLTKMFSEGTAFDAALATAQQLGYAEADPSADVEGTDACRKICILASMAFGVHVYPAQVHTEGITRLAARDVAYAAAFDAAIKLVGRARRAGDGDSVEIQVTPVFVPHAHMLAGVSDVYNAVVLRTDAADNVMFYGRGAGKFPTASAVLADVLEALRAGGHIPGVGWRAAECDVVAPHAQYPVRAYVCLSFSGDTAQLFTGLTPPERQLERPDKPQGEHAFVLPECTEAELAALLAELGRRGAAVLSTVRILNK